MKTTAVIVTVWALVCSMAFSQSAKQAAQGAQGTVKTQNVKALYVCPMHPEVTSDKPGTCPKCKMELVKIEKKKAAQAKDSAEKGAPEKAAVMYTCPMHPDVVADKPGKCPRCKMDLVKKNNDK